MSFLEVVNWLLLRLRGRGVADFGGVPTLRVILYILQRGFLPAIRGFAKRLFIGKTDGILFLGKQVRITTPSLLDVGANCFIGDYSSINCYSIGGVHLGRNVTIREFAWLQLTSRLDSPGSYVKIGDSTYIGPRVNLGAGAPLVIGARCQIGANVSFVCESHQIEAGIEIFSQGVERLGIEICDDCWIGNGAVILDGVKVGRGAVIGAGAVVTKDVAANVIVGGVPAKEIRSR